MIKAVRGSNRVGYANYIVMEKLRGVYRNRKLCYENLTPSQRIIFRKIVRATIEYLGKRYSEYKSFDVLFNHNVGDNIGVKRFLGNLFRKYKILR